MKRIVASGAVLLSLKPLFAVSPQPHIILLMTDQHRGDCIGAVNSRIKTPHIDALVNDGVLFTNGYSSTPSSTPARAGLLTGLSPWHHGMLGYGRVAQRYVYEMPQMLRDCGYYTYGIGKMHWFPQKALHGFHATQVDESGRVEQDGFVSDYQDWFRLNKPGADPYQLRLSWNDHRAGVYPHDESLHPTAWTAQTAVELIQNYALDAPLFLKVSFARPHSPYDPPQRFLNMYREVIPNLPFKAQWSDSLKSYPHRPDPAFGDFGEDFALHSRRHYYASITFIDEQIGRIIEVLRQKGMYDNAVICLVSDHGDMLGDFYHWRKTYAYEGSTKVPYVVKLPQSYHIQGVTNAKPVELRDLLPTFLEAAGSVAPGGMDGKSLIGLLTGQTTDWRRWIDLEHTATYEPWNDWCALTDGETKYIYFFSTGTEMMFDLKADPHELKELVSEGKEGKRLKLWRQRMVEHLTERGEAYVKEGKLQVLKGRGPYGPHFPRS